MKLTISTVQNIKKKNVPGTQDASRLESLVLLLLPPLWLLVVLTMVVVIVVVGSTCKKKKKLNISIVQNIKKKKMFLGLKTWGVSSPLACCCYRDATATFAATAAVAAGVDDGGVDGRVESVDVDGRRSCK